MKIDWFKRRTVTNPLEGVTFHKADELDIEDAAKTMADLEDPLLQVIRDALAHHVVYLDEAGEWTDNGSETEVKRRAELQSTLVAYQATYMARIARNFRPVKR